MSIVFDVIVLCFPFPVIRKLQMPWTRKLQVIAIFWLGIFCCVSSIVRFYFLYSEINGAIAVTGPDRYLKTSTAFIWATVEPNTSIIAACLPCYAPFFAKGRWLPSLWASFGGLFSRGSKAKAKHSGDDTFPLGSDGSDQIQGNKHRPWELISWSPSSHNVDIERANSCQVDQEPLKDHPFQVKVTQEFTRTESRGY